MKLRIAVISAVLFFVTTSCSSSKPVTQNSGDESSESSQEPESPQSVLQDDPDGQPSQSLNLNADAMQLQQRIVSVASAAILQVNQTINQGETLSTVQRNCIVNFAEGMGNPLLSLECRPNDTLNGTAVDARRAMVKDTAECRDDLQNNLSDRCQIINAEIVVATRWLQLENEGELTRRPQPNGGAILYLDIGEDLLRLTNLPEAITGYYACDYFLSTGQSAEDNQASNCQSQLPRTIELIDYYLSAQQ